MSSIVSLRPSARNQWKEAFWMSIRLGRSRTCSICEKDLRARGEATVVVKEGSLPWDRRDQANTGVRIGGRAERRRNQPEYRNNPLLRKQQPTPATGGLRNCSAPGRRRPADLHDLALEAARSLVLAPFASLLELDGGAGLLELGLDAVGLLLGDALLDRLGGRVDEVLRLLEAEAGEGAHDLDHLDLLLARPRQDDVERRLLLRRGRAVARRGCRDRHRRCGRDAPLVFNFLLQLDQLQDGHRPQLLEDGLDCGWHYSSSVLSSFLSAASCGLGVSSAGSGSAGEGVASAVGGASSGEASPSAVASAGEASASAAASSASATGVAAAAVSAPPSCSMRASISPCRFWSGAVTRPRSAVSGAMIAASTWLRRMSSGGSVARLSTSAALIGRPSRTPPRMASTLVSRAASASALAAATMSPSASRNAIALGPSSRASSASAPAASAALRVSVFFTTVKRAPLSSRRVRSKSICGMVRPR